MAYINSQRRSIERSLMDVGKVLFHRSGYARTFICSASSIQMYVIWTLNTKTGVRRTRRHLPLYCFVNLLTKLVDTDEYHYPEMTRQLVTMPLRTERYNHCPSTWQQHISVQASLFLINYPSNQNTKAFFGFRVQPYQSHR